MKNIILSILFLLVGITIGYQWQVFVYNDECLDMGGGRNPGGHKICVIDEVLSPVQLGTDPRLIGGDAEPGSSLDDVRIKAVGTEPFWNFDYNHGALVWSAPATNDTGDISSVRYDVGFAREEDNYFLRGLGDLGRDLYISIAKKDCSDGMSDREYTHRVKATLSDMEYMGCANILQN